MGKRKRECWESNRDVVRRPKFEVTVCSKCDDMGANNFTKCSICGTTNKFRIRRNKPSPR